MSELINNPAFWTFLGGLGAQIMTQVITLQLVKQKQSFQDQEIKRLEGELEKNKTNFDGQIREHKDSSEKRDKALWETVSEIRTFMNDMKVTLARVETKIEVHNKGE